MCDGGSYIKLDSRDKRTVVCSASCAFRRATSDAWALESGMIGLDGPAIGAAMGCGG